MAEYETDSSMLRDLMSDSFDENGLTLFCYDHFNPLYKTSWVKSVGKQMKAQIILEHCQMNNIIGILLDLIKEKNPGQFEKFNLTI